MKIGLFCATILCIAIAASGDSPSSIRCLVVDDSGSPIKGAYVVIHESSAANPSLISSNWATQTGPDGRFSVKMKSGCYDIFVSNLSFEPLAKRACVKDAEIAELKLKMKASQQVLLRLE